MEQAEIDKDTIDEAVLALLWLNDSKTGSAWKGFDWAAMERFHERDLTSSPRRKRKSVYFTEARATEGERLFHKLFVRLAD